MCKNLQFISLIFNELRKQVFSLISDMSEAFFFGKKKDLRIIRVSDEAVACFNMCVLYKDMSWSERSDIKLSMGDRHIGETNEINQQVKF